MRAVIAWKGGLQSLKKLFCVEKMLILKSKKILGGEPNCQKGPPPMMLRRSNIIASVWGFV